jgi:glycine/D-amino acid oxidase-like deaminating enzyme
MKQKVVIIGGGIIGLSVGWQLAKKGYDVEILERDKAGKSSAMPQQVCLHRRLKWVLKILTFLPLQKEPRIISSVC